MISGVSQKVQWLKYLPANAGDTRDVSSVPELGTSPGEGNRNPPQYPCLENSMEKGERQDTVLGGHKESDMTE